MRTRRAGTSLIELLVVIVVFLVGILAMLQIFPGGLRILQNTRNMSVARQLASAEMERVVSRALYLPDAIVGVQYVPGASWVDIVAVDNTSSEELSYTGTELTANGEVIRDGNNVGRWDLLNASNRIRRIVAEGGPVPAPRQVGGDFGGLMLVNFAPISYDPSYPTLLQIYGNDMSKREGTPGFRIRPWDYYLEDVEEPTARIYLPRDTTVLRRYRLAMSAWIANGGSTSRRTIIDATIDVPPDPTGGAVGFDLSAYAALQAGETFVGAEWDSIEVARAYLPVATFTNGQPYEYRVLDARLGVLLFNPAGYDYKERRGNRQIPLVARVNYDVFDWRIIRDEFRITNLAPYQQRLQLGNLKVQGNQRPDGQIYSGLDVLVSDGTGGTETRDLLLLDLETGGVYLPDSYRVDKSVGLITCIDVAPGTPGMQMNLVLPGQAAPTTVNAFGRAVRALYQANLEWSVQVMKAPARFHQTYSPPSTAQYYVGGSGLAGGNVRRIYFPLADVGRKVVIGEIWYRDGGGNLHSMRDQDFVIQNAPLDPFGPYIDISNVDPNAASFDFATYGYAVRRVKGASVAVRVLWNPSFFGLTADTAENQRRFEQWSRDWRRTSVETFLPQGEK